MASCAPARIQVPLDIPNVEALRSAVRPDGTLLIWVESQVERTGCGRCGRAIRCTLGHGLEIRLCNRSMPGQETYIGNRPRRGRCLDCETQPTTTQVLDGYDQRCPHTKAYDRYLLKQPVNSTIGGMSMSCTTLSWGDVNRQTKTAIDCEQVDDPARLASTNLPAPPRIRRRPVAIGTKSFDIQKLG